MTTRRTITFALMDAPYESARCATALRLIDAAIRRGHDINVFAYEGAVGLSFARQRAHANAVHNRTVEEEAHFLPREVLAGLMGAATRRGVTLDWVNCGLCVDERGVEDTIPGVRRGSPADFWKMAAGSVNTLVIPTR